MSTENDAKLSRSPRGRHASAAADTRTVRRLGARIFADLLPTSTHDREPVPASPGLGSSLEDTEGSHSGANTRPVGPIAADLHTPAALARKETPTMRAYRTQARYYFSTRQLLPAGSLVFFSDKLQRYVHPTDGTLLDPHPRLQELSDAESQELTAHWQTALARY